MSLQLPPDHPHLLDPWRPRRPWASWRAGCSSFWSCIGGRGSPRTSRSARSRASAWSLPAWPRSPGFPAAAESSGSCRARWPALPPCSGAPSSPSPAPSYKPGTHFSGPRCEFQILSAGWPGRGWHFPRCRAELQSPQSLCSHRRCLSQTPGTPRTSCSAPSLPLAWRRGSCCLRAVFQDPESPHLSAGSEPPPRWPACRPSAAWPRCLAGTC
mmetsp:Transcript_55389/g.89534  ORF Transcript_55389/g.89534 Transcript_55389/m.89534 type:complete len:213 (-) Transcript_55389:250-888(-)